MTSAAAAREERREKKARREIVTPEGVPLSFAVASAGDRLAAFMVDALIILLILVVGAVATCVMSVAERATGTDVGSATGITAIFLIRNCYFTWFEARRLGATPGKRFVGIRVIDRSGGALRVEAVVARNLMRDLEIFLPLQMGLSSELFWSDLPSFARVVPFLWACAFALFPLFNRDRLRTGDLVGGTIVVEAPRALLYADLAGKAAAAAAAPTYVFTAKELDVYGEYELQILEEVLRGGANGLAVAHREETYAAVTDKVLKKIGRRETHRHVRPEVFLRDYYAALRARLEQRLLFGKRKKDKFS